MGTSDNSRNWHCSLAGQDTCHLQGPYAAISVTLGSRKDDGIERWAHLCPHTSQEARDPLLRWAVLMLSCCPLSGTQVTGRGAMRGSQGTLQRHMTLMGMLLLSLPAISQEGPWQLMAAPWGAVHGESLEPPTDAGRQAMSLPAGHWAQQGWAVLWSGREHPGG